MSVEDDEKNVWPEPKELIDGCAVVDDREERKKDRRPIPYNVFHHHPGQPITLVSFS
jgi:hypothetical protein